MSKNKCILCIVSTPPPTGGASQMNQNTINILGNNGFRIIHINPKYAKETSDRETVQFRKVLELVKIFCKTFFYLTFYKIDKVYYGLSSNSHAFIKDFIILSVPIIFKNKIVIHLHLSNLPEFYSVSNDIIKIMIRFIVRKTNVFIACSDNLKNKFSHIIPKEKMFAIENGIASLDNNINRHFDKDKIVCLYLGILIKSKGYPIVIEAAKYISEKNIIFYIVGPPGNDFDENETRKFIKENGLEEKVFLLGPKYGLEKGKIFLESDIFVFPTAFGPEAFPLVLLEAMSFGLNIISTKTGAIPECIKEDHNGFLIDKIDPREIASKIIYLNKHRQKMKEISLNNIKSFNAKYSIEQYEQNILKVFIQ